MLAADLLPSPSLKDHDIPRICRLCRGLSVIAMGVIREKQQKQTYRSASQGQFDLLPTLYTFYHVLNYAVAQGDAECLQGYVVARVSRALQKEAGIRNRQSRHFGRFVYVDFKVNN